MKNKFTYGKCPNCRVHIFFPGIKVKRIDNLAHKICPNCGIALVTPRAVRWFNWTAMAIWLGYLVVLPSSIKQYLWGDNLVLGDVATFIFLVFFCFIISWLIGFRKAAGVGRLN